MASPVESKSSHLGEPPLLGLLDGKEDHVTQGLKKLVEAHGTEQYAPVLLRKSSKTPTALLWAAWTLQRQHQHSSARCSATPASKVPSAPLRRAILSSGSGYGRAAAPFLRILASAKTVARPRKRASPRPKKGSPDSNGNGGGNRSGGKRAEEEIVQKGTQRYPLYFKNKPAGCIVVPESLTLADCKVIELQMAVLKAYASHK